MPASQGPISASRNVQTLTTCAFRCFRSSSTTRAPRDARDSGGVASGANAPARRACPRRTPRRSSRRTPAGRPACGSSSGRRRRRPPRRPSCRRRSSMSVFSDGHDVIVRPLSTSASTSVHGPWQITPTGLPCLEERAHERDRVARPCAGSPGWRRRRAARARRSRRRLPRSTVLSTSNVSALSRWLKAWTSPSSSEISSGVGAGLLDRLPAARSAPPARRPRRRGTRSSCL